MVGRWKLSLSAAALVVVLGNWASVEPAFAQHDSYRYYDGERYHAPRLRVGPGGVEFDSGYGHHRRDRWHHRRHCYQVESHDHHGRHRYRTVCEDDD